MAEAVEKMPIRVSKPDCRAHAGSIATCRTIAGGS
jgi:hypothetical protein